MAFAPAATQRFWVILCHFSAVGSLKVEIFVKMTALGLPLIRRQALKGIRQGESLEFLARDVRRLQRVVQRINCVTL